MVQQLEGSFGAQQFGQIMQTLLAISFRNAGFEVIKNSVGVPDLQAFHRSDSEGFAIEAKTGKRSISLSKRDLDGVRSTGRIPVVAAFFITDPKSRWWLVDARALRVATYRRYEIEAKPKVNVGFDLTDRFSRILASNIEIAMQGPGPLSRVLAG
jgi:hypothetical protein